jgi:hypothetical protein
MRILRAIALTTMVLGLVTPARAADRQHCSYRLVPVDQVGTVTTAELELIGCFSSFEQAIEVGSGRSVDIAPTESPATLTDGDLTVSVAAADVLIGTEYNLTGFAGTSHNYFAPTTCSSVTTWQVAYVGDSLNDLFSSGKGFGGCDTNRKFEHSNFGGAVKTCTPNCSDYGALSNEVSSLRWRV